MKPKKVMPIYLVILFILLVLPTGVPAQNAPGKIPQHHHYKLIEVSTFGGLNFFANFKGLGMPALEFLRRISDGYYNSSQPGLTRQFSEVRPWKLLPFGRDNRRISGQGPD